MAPMRRGFSRGAFRSPARKTSWELGPGGGAQQASSASEAIIVGAGVVAVEDGMTLVRLRGELLLYLRGAATIAGGFRGAFGIGIVEANAFGIGVTAVPTPITEEAWDGWLYHRYWNLFTPGARVTSNAADEENQGSAGASVLRVEVDSKAMRKLKTEDVIFAAIEHTEEGTCDLRVNFNSRTLVKLS